MKRCISLALAIVMSAFGVAAQQAPAPSVQAKVAEFKQLLAANQQARRQYQWLETSQLAYNGVVKTTKVSDCQYSGAVPKPQCTEITLQQAPLEGGFVRRKIEEKKGAELKVYMDSVRTLIGEYVPLNQEMVDKAYQSGNVLFSTDPAAGTNRLIITNYKQKGDTVTVIWNAGTMKLSWVKFSTWLNTPKAPVTASVQFSLLPNGVFYAYRKNVSAPAAGVSVTITASDFTEGIKP